MLEAAGDANQMSFFDSIGRAGSGMAQYASVGGFQ